VSAEDLWASAPSAARAGGGLHRPTRQVRGHGHRRRAPPPGSSATGGADDRAPASTGHV